MHLTQKLDYVRLPFDLATLPHGWFSKHQVNILYQVAQIADGPMLEIGPWIGRSTCVIGEALKRKENPNYFCTVDYFFDDEKQWEVKFGHPLRDKPNFMDYLVHIEQEGGAIESLKRNLKELEIDHLVDVVKGDFLEIEFQKKFDFVFSDAMHGVLEIRKNLPATLALLNPGGYLLCDDVATPEERNAIVDGANFDWHFVDSLLFYGKLAAE